MRKVSRCILISKEGSAFCWVEKPLVITNMVAGLSTSLYSVLGVAPSDLASQRLWAHIIDHDLEMDRR